MTRTVHAVFWDFGGVFTSSPFGAVESYAAELGIGHDELFGIVFGAYDEDGAHPWHRLERGELSLEDASKAMVALARERGVDFDMASFFGRMRGPDGAERLEVMGGLVREFDAAGIRQGIITNNVREFSDGWRSLLPVDELFADVVDSSAVGVRKPNPVIYEMAMERLGVSDPATALFVDDMPANVAAAEAVGMQGIVARPDVHATAAHLRALVLP